MIDPPSPALLSQSQSQHLLRDHNPSSCRELVPALACGLGANCRIHCSTSSPLTCRMLWWLPAQSRREGSSRRMNPTKRPSDAEMLILECVHQQRRKKLLEFPQPLYLMCHHDWQELVGAPRLQFSCALTQTRSSPASGIIFFSRVPPVAKRKGQKDMR